MSVSMQSIDVRTEIERRSAVFAQHFANKDAESLVRDYYVDAPFISPPDGKLLRTREAALAFIQGAMNVASSCSFEHIEIRAEGDLAYEIGAARFILNSGEPIASRYLAVWRRGRDGWRVEADFLAPSSP